MGDNNIDLTEREVFRCLGPVVINCGRLEIVGRMQEVKSSSYCSTLTNMNINALKTEYFIQTQCSCQFHCERVTQSEDKRYPMC